MRMMPSVPVTHRKLFPIPGAGAGHGTARTPGVGLPRLPLMAPYRAMFSRLPGEAGCTLLLVWTVSLP